MSSVWSIIVENKDNEKTSSDDSSTETWEVSSMTIIETI